jgi:hypothetical protein
VGGRAPRDAARDGTSYVDWDVAALHAAFAERTPRLGLWLDTSEQTPDETVTAILAAREDALT